ncbi:MAG: prepilin-type N-terminal cleavage/methylation domain-containing protein [Clostridium sp.]
MKRAADEVHSNRGVTLIELVIGMSILIVVGLMVASLLASSLRMYRTTITSADMQTESQTVSRRIDSVVMNAQNIYFDDTADGVFLFTGTITSEANSKKYMGEILWLNKQTHCMYQNSRIVVYVPDGSDHDANGKPVEVGALTSEEVKKALEQGNQSDAREFLISDKIKSLDFSISPKLEEIDKIGDGNFYAAKQKLTLNYVLTLSSSNGKDYQVNSGVTPRNPIGFLRW